MARTRRIKKDGDGHYHVMSRTNGKAFLFGSGRFKTEMVSPRRCGHGRCSKERSRRMAGG